MKNLTLIILGTFLFSCVSKQKFADTVLLKDHYKTSLDSLKKEGIPAAYGDDRSYLKYDMKRAEIQLKQATDDLLALQENFDNLQLYNNDVLQRYDELLVQNQQLLSSTSNGTQQLAGQLYEKQRINDELTLQVQRLQNQVRQLEGTVASTSDTPIEYSRPPVYETPTNDCAAYENQIAQLNSLLREKDNRLIQLRTGLNKALLGFSASDLSVAESQGKIYVSLSQNLLFPPSSTKIDQNGQRALQSLATVLKRNPDISINVEGHTDSDGSAQKNWNLSVNRAVAVVNVLTSFGVDPKRITASGKSYFSPIASNNTARGKAKNRRTEIILTPRLDELYRIINY